MVFLWSLVIISAVVAGLVFVGTVVGADSAPKQAAGAAIALCCVVIPYCFARACSEVADRSRDFLIKELRALNEKVEGLASNYPDNGAPETQVEGPEEQGK